MAGVFKPKSPKGGSLAQVAGTRGTGLNFSKSTSSKIMDPLGLKKSSPKKAPPTAEELALEIRQRKALDEATAESEKKLKALARGTLGRQSLLSGAPKTEMQAATRSRSSGAGGAGSLLGGAGGTGAGSGGGFRSEVRTSGAMIK